MARTLLFILFTVLFAITNVQSKKGDGDVGTLGKIIPPPDPDTPQPTLKPTKRPTDIPSLSPSDKPTLIPSNLPSSNPSLIPSNNPSTSPSDNPSLIPTTLNPTNYPTTNKPTENGETWEPSKTPTNAPSNSPSAKPSSTPSIPPTNIPSANPSSIPTSFPSTIPSITPTKMPSILTTMETTDSTSSVEGAGAINDGNNKTAWILTNSMPAIPIQALCLLITVILFIFLIYYFTLSANQINLSIKIPVILTFFSNILGIICIMTVSIIMATRKWDIISYNMAIIPYYLVSISYCFGKFSLEMFFIFRLKNAFAHSTFAISSCLFYILLIWMCIISTMWCYILLADDDYNLPHGYLIVSISDAAFLLILLYLFASRLAKLLLLQNNDKLSEMSSTRTTTTTVSSIQSTQSRSTTRFHHSRVKSVSSVRDSSYLSSKSVSSSLSSHQTKLIYLITRCIILSNIALITTSIFGIFAFYFEAYGLHIFIVYALWAIDMTTNCICLYLNFIFSNKFYKIFCKLCHYSTQNIVKLTIARIILNNKLKEIKQQPVPHSPSPESHTSPHSHHSRTISRQVDADADDGIFPTSPVSGGLPKPLPEYDEEYDDNDNDDQVISPVHAPPPVPSHVLVTNDNDNDDDDEYEEYEYYEYDDDNVADVANVVPVAVAVSVIPIQYLSIEEAKKKKIKNKEKYLNDNDFETVFGLKKEEFYNLKGWKQINLKKEKGFF